MVHPPLAVRRIMGRHLVRWRHHQGLREPPAEKDHVRTVHDKIAQAIVGGNAKRAEQLMREHMEEYAKNLVARHPSLMEEVVDWR